MDAPSFRPDELAQRRRRAARTAWTVAALAVLIYAGFILSGVLAT